MTLTNIPWADRVWNPVTGCTPVSEGCRYCYARRMAETRLRGRFGYDQAEPFKVTLHPDRLDEPYSWRKPAKIFVCSMGDLFHPNVPREVIVSIAGRMVDCPHHTFMLLTKRPERMREIAEDLQGFGPNVWLGVSVEDQETADKRIPVLLRTPAEKRFVSIEPMLEPIDFGYPHVKQFHPNPAINAEIEADYRDAVTFDENAGIRKGWHRGLDWVIAGCETGPGARPARPEWFRSVRDQCKAAGIPFFMKKATPRASTGMLDGVKHEERPR